MSVNHHEDSRLFYLQWIYFSLIFIWRKRRPLTVPHKIYYEWNYETRKLNYTLYMFFRISLYCIFTLFSIFITSFCLNHMGFILCLVRLKMVCYFILKRTKKIYKICSNSYIHNYVLKEWKVPPANDLSDIKNKDMKFWKI